MMREMQSPAGRLLLRRSTPTRSTRRASSTSGRRDEVRALLTAEEYAVAAPHYGLDGQPNFEGKHWHLAIVQPLKVIAAGLGRGEEECASSSTQRARSSSPRAQQRVRPGRDDKMLVSWNALMIRGMARAGARVRPRRLARLGAARAGFHPQHHVAGRRACSPPARTAARISTPTSTTTRSCSTRCSSCCRRTSAAPTSRSPRELAEALLDAVRGRRAGGFFFTSHDHERLIHRPKPGHDNATPSGNGVAAFALGRLGHLTGEPRYLDAARARGRGVLPGNAAHPGGFGALTIALEECLAPPEVIVLRGPTPRLRPWLKELTPEFRPHSVLVGIDGAEGGLPAALDKPVAPGPGQRLGVPGRYLPRAGIRDGGVAPAARRCRNQVASRLGKVSSQENE